MDDQEFRTLIEQLQAEIQKTQSVDEKGQEMLTRLDSDIHELIKRTGGHALPVHPSMIQRLQEGLDHFEVSHPALTLLLGKLLESLSNVGI